jgi:group I intron endonuclease
MTLPVACSSFPRSAKYLSSFNIQPKIVFENLHKDGIKKKVVASIKPLAGVYVIINLINGSTYVGSAIRGQMPYRFHKHLFSLNGSKLVAAAVQKYGLENFAFVVADIISSAEDNKIILKMEDFFIQQLRPEYNIALKAGNTFGVKHTEDTKLRMRIHYSLKRREQIGALNRGKNLSAATIELIRQGALNRSPMSDETRVKIRANSTMTNLYSVSRVDGELLSNDKKEIILQTLLNVAKFCNCHEKTVRRALSSTGIVKKT